MVFQTAPFSMTLKEHNPDFKVRPFFDAEYLQNGCSADTAIVTMDAYRKPYPHSNGTTFNDLE